MFILVTLYNLIMPWLWDRGLAEGKKTTWHNYTKTLITLKVSNNKKKVWKSNHAPLDFR